MTITTASPDEAFAPPLDRRGRHRWVRFAGPVLALLIAGLAVGRFLLVGSPTPATAPAPVAATGTGLEALRLATTQRPGDAAAWRDYGVAAVREAVRTGDPSFYGVAGTALGEAARLAPDDALVLTARAVLALSLHDFAGALPLASRAVLANPLSTAALAALVDAQVENGDYVAGEAALQRLLNTDPGVAAYARVSYLRQLTGDLVGAQLAMRQAVAASGSGPTRAVVLTYLGDVSLEMGLLDDAAQAYSAAQRDQPGFVLAEVGAARVLIARGSLTEAATLLDALVARSPQPAVATLRGDLATLMGDPAAAGRAFALVRANDQILRSQGVVTDLESAIFNADRGAPDLALAEARAAYSARRTVFTADAMAWALVRAGRAGDAVPFAEEAVARGITTPSVRVHAAAVFSAAGDVVRARSELAVAFGSRPWLTPAIRPVALDLAARLGLEFPEEWTL